MKAEAEAKARGSSKCSKLLLVAELEVPSPPKHEQRQAHTGHTL